MEDELKPCPFCGNKPKESPEGILVRCGIPCDNSLWYHRSEWQNRPIEDALRAELDQTRAELAAMKQADEYNEAEADAMLPEVVRQLRAELDAARGKWYTRAEEPAVEKGVFLTLLKYPSGEKYQSVEGYLDGEWSSKFVTHWRPLPAPPEEE